MRPLSTPQLNPASESGWRRRWFDIIFRHDTPPSRNFDLLLIVAILASVIVIMLSAIRGCISTTRGSCTRSNGASPHCSPPST